MRAPTHPVLTLLVVVGLTVGLAATPGRPARASQNAPSSAHVATRESWEWPLEQFRVVAPYVAPAHAYGPGHRGLDLEPIGSANVRAPASGVIAFSGTVAGRTVLTIDHGGGLVTTLEPVRSLVGAGTRVLRGDDLGTIATGGHAPPGAVHFGVRLDGQYINPLLLLGRLPRAVLLPCCA